jgi:hypothetical protein
MSYNRGENASDLEKANVRKCEDIGLGVDSAKCAVWPPTSKSPTGEGLIVDPYLKYTRT